MKYEVMVNTRINTLDVEVWVFLRNGNHLTNIGLGGTKITQHEITGVHLQVEPFAIMDAFTWQGVGKALVESLTNSGVKPDADSVREGEMKAMKYHLEDMRRLVFSDSEGA